MFASKMAAILTTFTITRLVERAITIPAVPDIELGIAPVRRNLVDTWVLLQRSTGMNSRGIQSWIGLVLLGVLVASWPAFVVGQENEPLARIKTPSPSSFTDTERSQILEVSRWMSKIVVATTANSYECSVQYEVNRTGATKQVAGAPKFDSVIARVGIFRMGQQVGTGVRRILTTFQPALGHDFDSEQLARRTRMLDIYQRDGQTALLMGNGHAVNDEVMRAEQGTFSYLHRTSGVFHPSRACVVSVVQSLTGGAMEIGGHSVLPSTIKGVITSGPDTHVFIDMKIVLMMVTFRDQCPVQLEMWRPQQNPNQEREVTDVVRSVWTEVHEGIKLPTRIEGMQMSRFRTAELNATISWRLKDRVDKDFFDESTLGLLMPAFQSPN